MHLATSIVLDLSGWIKFRTSRRIALFWAVITAQVFPLFAQPQDVYVQVKSGVVGPERASLYAVSNKVFIKKGIQELVLDGFGNSIDPKSIRSKIDGEHSRIVSIRIDSVNHHRANETFNKLEGAISILQDTLISIEQSLKRLEYLEEVLKHNRQITVSDKSIYVDDLDELLDYYRNKRRLFDNEKQYLEHHRKSVSHQIDSLETAKNAVATTLGINRPLLYVQIAAENDEEIGMEFWYDVSEVSWRPSYSVSLVDSEVGEVAMSSHLKQSTGVDWQGIQLSLSYGEQFIARNQYRTNKTTNGITVSNPFSVVRVDQPISLKHGETTFLNGVAQFPVKYDITHYCIPEQSNLAVENIKFTRLSGVYLPKGAAVIEGGERVQISDTLENTFFDDSLVYSMGFTSDILVTKQLEKEKFKKSIIGNKQSISVSWRLEMKNERSEDVWVTILDRLPSTKKTSVVIENDLPKGAVLVQGALSYTVKLKANETTEVSYGFQINTPKGETIKDYYNN